MIERLYHDVRELLKDYLASRVILFDASKVNAVSVSSVFFRVFEPEDIHRYPDKFISIIDIARCARIQSDSYEMVSIFKDLAQKWKDNLIREKEVIACNELARFILMISGGMTDGFLYIDEDSLYADLIKPVPEKERTEILKRQYRLEEIGRYISPVVMDYTKRLIIKQDLSYDTKMFNSLTEFVSRIDMIRKTYQMGGMDSVRIENFIDLSAMDNTIPFDPEHPLYQLVLSISKNQDGDVAEMQCINEYKQAMKAYT